MLHFTAEVCNRDLSLHEPPSHGAALTQIPIQHQFLLGLAMSFCGSQKDPMAKCKAWTSAPSAAPCCRPLVSLPDVSQHSTEENDTRRQAEGAEPLLASGLLLALAVIWKQSQLLWQGRAGLLLFSSLFWASHGSQNMYTHLSTNLPRASTHSLEHSCRFFYRGKLSLL